MIDPKPLFPGARVALVAPASAVPEEKLPEAVAFIQACMDAPPFPEMDVPIVAEAAYGPDFGHMKEME